MSIDASAASRASELIRFDEHARALLQRMTLSEKIGQMAQVNSAGGSIPDALREALKAGEIGSVLNEVDFRTVNELQRIAVEDSRLGIPLLVGRDVIHGFKTVLPIPLGQAATWNPDLVQRGARMAALEAAAAGVNWTFAPMIDVTRDPRWGRIAESLGEDPHLHSVLGAAMVRGFQGDDLALPGAIAACAKHFAGYGASESGRDYNTTNIPENEMRNVHLRPFRAAVDAGVATLMTSFSDLDGVPASANRFLLRQVLREEWGFQGFVVSDWASIEQLTVHGFTANDREAALAAVTAGVNMEMATRTYADHLAGLVEEGRIDEALIDEMVTGILRVKFALGLFENPYTDPVTLPAAGNADHLALARESALQSIVLLENRNGVLPLRKESLRSLAVIGPLADDPYEQLGTWIYDGDPALSQTALQAIQNLVGDAVRVSHVRAMETTRSRSTAGFDEAVALAAGSDAVVVFLGEESILSGEAHSRADIGLPGNQAELVRRLHQTGKPVIAVILAGRPLTLAEILDHADAVLFAWHPGTMGGPAIADLLFGIESPSGKLPVTFPRMVGQVPIYYAHKHGGKPATPETFQHIDDIPARMPQSSSGWVSSHLDAGYTPLYPFGYGLSYTEFRYSDVAVSSPEALPGETLTVSARVTNTGDVAATEVVQLYVRDLVGNVTRPVKELKGFQRIRLQPGEGRTVEFAIGPDDLAFYDRNMNLTTEPGEFHAWIGGSSETGLRTSFALVDK
ncbi:MAG: glycoside hydrolase family 3 C-terminal domain-containing protein [Xanthomonadales bacterium]|jgi:beta-glucosidase|nr:glycoside hydrolase family 3 C-terminal domain-containing protein [Xanthomonadales bacterium]